MPSDAPVEVPDTLACLFKGDIASRFAALPASDRLHLLTVATMLAERGASADLVTAGLIHDIGKQVPGIRVTIPDRVIKVLMDWLTPSAVTRLKSRPTPPMLGKGVWVLCRHAQTGAEAIAAAGYNDRVHWLVAHHEHHDLDDPELALLAEVDEASFPSSTR